MGRRSCIALASFDFDLNLFLSIAAPSAVPHSKCGLHILASAHGDGQLVVNPFVYEEVTVERTGQMVADGIYYELACDPNGHGLLVAEGYIDKPMLVKSLPFTKVAVQGGDDRVAVQHQIQKTVHWADSWEHLKSRKPVTLKINSKDDIRVVPRRKADLGYKGWFTTFSRWRSVLGIQAIAELIEVNT